MNHDALLHLKQRLKCFKIVKAGREIQLALHKHFIQAPDPDLTVVSLRPEQSAQGCVLLSYILEPFLLKPGAAVSLDHTHDWESLQMAKTFLELGYEVDVISYRNQAFVPDREYSLVIDVRKNLERWGPILGSGCRRVAHLDTAHLLFQSSAELRRLLDLQQRRGITLVPRRNELPNYAIEHADHACVLGNEFTIGTYRYAGKPIHRIPISTPMLYDWDDGKDFDGCRRRFLWFGSSGLVHKGLDLVLEVFTQLPEFHLTVCGPIAREKDFQSAYQKELYQTPNILTLDWVDVRSQQFIELCRKTLGVISASCSEGGGGSVIGCMHAGLIPIVNQETSVDIKPSYGVLLDNSSIPEIKQRVQEVSDLPEHALRSMAHGAWSFVRSNHTRERFAERFREVMAGIMSPSVSQTSLLPRNGSGGMHNRPTVGA